MANNDTHIRKKANSGWIGRKSIKYEQTERKATHADTNRIFRELRKEDVINLKGGDV